MKKLKNILVTQNLDSDTLNDIARFIWKLRNEESARLVSRNASIISIEDHFIWFNKKINDTGCYLYVFQLGNNMVSMVRLDLIKEKGVYEISVIVKSDFRGKGISSQSIKNILTIHSELPIHAEIKKNNNVSQRLFENLGFIKIGQKDEFLEYKLR